MSNPPRWLELNDLLIAQPKGWGSSSWALARTVLSMFDTMTPSPDWPLVTDVFSLSRVTSADFLLGCLDDNNPERADLDDFFRIHWAGLSRDPAHHRRPGQFSVREDYRRVQVALIGNHDLFLIGLLGQLQRGEVTFNPDRVFAGGATPKPRVHL